VILFGAAIEAAISCAASTSQHNAPPPS